MKFLNRLTDWKVWLFMLLPAIMFAVWLGIMIYAYTQHVSNSLLVICAQVLFVVAALLITGYAILLRIKQKNYVRSIAAIAFIICFLALQITAMTMIPKLFITSQEERDLYQIYKESSIDDTETDEKWDAWWEAHKKVNDIETPLQLISGASLLSFALSSLCVPAVKPKNNETNNVREDKNLKEA